MGPMVGKRGWTSWLVIVGFWLQTLQMGPPAQASHSFWNRHWHKANPHLMWTAGSGSVYTSAALRNRFFDASEDPSHTNWTTLSSMNWDYRGFNSAGHHQNRQVTYDHSTMCHFACSPGGRLATVESLGRCSDGVSQYPCPSGSHLNLTRFHIWVDKTEDWYTEESTSVPPGQPDLWSSLSHELGHMDMPHVTNDATHCPANNTRSTMCASVITGTSYTRAPNTSDVANANAAEAAAG